MLGECCIVSANVKHWTAGSLGRPFPMCISQTIEKKSSEGEKQIQTKTKERSGMLSDTMSARNSETQNKNTVGKSDFLSVRLPFPLTRPLHPFKTAVLTYIICMFLSDCQIFTDCIK